MATRYRAVLGYSQPDQDVAAESFHQAQPLARPERHIALHRPFRQAWFTDSPASPPWEHGEDLVAVTCGGESFPGLPVRAFEPLLEVPLPGLPALRIPPVLEILDLCERERYAEILIDTPGPVGLAGLLAGKLLGIRLTAIQRVDLPSAVRRLSGSPALEDLTRIYTRWFYGQMDRVHTAEETAGEPRSRMTA